MKQRERKGKRLVCLLKFLLLRKDIKGCYKFAKRREGKNLMDCEFPKKKKRLSNELLQNALKKKKLLCRSEQLATYHFCIKRKLVFFLFLGKFWKILLKVHLRRLGEN